MSVDPNICADFVYSVVYVCVDPRRCSESAGPADGVGLRNRVDGDGTAGSAHSPGICCPSQTGGGYYTCIGCCKNITFYCLTTVVHFTCCVTL